MQNKDNDKGNEDWLSIVEEKRIEKFIVEMHMPSVVMYKSWTILLVFIDKGFEERNLK
jgi:hypothetical protein